MTTSLAAEHGHHSNAMGGAIELATEFPGYNIRARAAQPMMSRLKKRNVLLAIALTLLVPIGAVPAQARIIADPSDERGHIVVIDEIPSTTERFLSLEDSAIGTTLIPSDAHTPIEHAYVVAEVARERCQTCAITIVSIKQSLLSECLGQVFDFIERHPAAQVVVISSVGYPKGSLESDVPSSEAMIAKLLATGRVVIAVSTVNTQDEENFFDYPANSSKVLTVGSMAHRGLFGTKVDVVTRDYDLQRPGRFIEGNSLAAPQLALVARIVKENSALSVQAALRIVLNTTDFVWHRYAKRYVHLINEERALTQAKNLNVQISGRAR